MVAVTFPLRKHPEKLKKWSIPSERGTCVVAETKHKNAVNIKSSGCTVSKIGA